MATGLICGFIAYLIHKKYHLKTASKNIISIIIVFLIIIFGINFYRIQRSAIDSNDTTQHSAAYLIVLGGGVKKNGKLGTIAKQRIYYAALYLKKYPETIVIVSGGKGKQSPTEESSVLAKELEKLGIQKKRILEENKALDTIQNLSYSAELMARNSHMTIKEILKQPVAILTSKYHLARAERIARREGYSIVYGIPAKTPFLFLLNAYTREIGSYIKLDLRILFTGKPSTILM